MTMLPIFWLAHNMAGMLVTWRSRQWGPSPPSTPSRWSPPATCPGTQPPLPRHPGTQAPRHPGTQVPRHPGTQAPRYPGTQAPRHPGTQAPLTNALRYISTVLVYGKLRQKSKYFVLFWWCGEATFYGSFCVICWNSAQVWGWGCCKGCFHILYEIFLIHFTET